SVRSCRARTTATAAVVERSCATGRCEWFPAPSRPTRRWTRSVGSRTTPLRRRSATPATWTFSRGPRRRALPRAPPPPLPVTRPASAGDSAQWVGDDSIRPLDDRGRRQAALLVEQLAPFRIERILLRPFTRCVQKVEPLAEARSLEVELIDDLAEGAGPKCGA